jgi:hypothetical protein
VSDRIQEVAERANVPEEFVRQLVAADALVGEEGELELAGAVRRVRLLRSWTAAGLSVETILTLVNRGALSLAFLDGPVMALPERLDCSYEQLATDRGVPMSFLQALHQSLGFAPPESGDRAGEDDATMLEVAGLFRAAGATDDATLRLLAVYADNLRRIAKAEADYYEANVERRLRAEGLDERQLIEVGTQLGDRVIGFAGASAPDGLPPPSRACLDRARHQPRRGGTRGLGSPTTSGAATGHLLCRPDRLHPPDRGARRRGRR